MVNKQQRHRQKDLTGIVESLQKCPPCQLIVSLKVPPCQLSLQKCPPCWLIVSPKVTHCLLSLWKCPHCRSIVSPKVNPCWLTVYSKSVPLSIKQQRSTCRKCKIENIKRKITVFEWSSLNFNYLPLHIYLLAFVQVLSSRFFPFFHHKCDFWFLDVISRLTTIY